MKKYILIAFSLIMTISAGNLLAQDQEMKYLFQGKDKDVSISGFAGIFNEFSGFDGDFAFSMGGGAALLIDQRFYIGGYGLGLTTRHLKSYDRYNYDGTELDNLVDVYTRFGHGGFWLGYIHNPKKAINFGGNLKLGWGSYSLTDKKYPGEDYKWENYAIDNVFVITPQADLNMNLLKWMRLSVGVGYRIVTGVDKTYYTMDENNNLVEKPYMEKNALNSVTGNITLAFGWFNN